MHTITLKIDDRIYDKLIRQLSEFSRDEVEIVIDEPNFAEIKKYLDAELDDITSGNAKFLSVEEAEKQLENSSVIEAGLEDVKAGRITFIDPKNIWEGIK